MEIHMIHIEQAHVSDIPKIKEFQLAHAHEVEGLCLDSMRVFQGVSEVFENGHHGFYLVARDLAARNHPRSCIGSLLITKEWSDWRAKPIWWIQSAYVIPEWRRKGVFTKMYQFIEEQAHQQNVAGLRLYVEKQNLGAKETYFKQGMTDTHYDMFEKLF